MLDIGSSCKRFRTMSARKLSRHMPRFKRDPSHPGLNFELIDRQTGIWSDHVNDNYCVLGLRDGSEITWFWIGTHREYEKLLRRS